MNPQQMFLSPSFSFVRGIVIGCVFIRISLRIPRLSSTPGSLQLPSYCTRLIRFLNSLKFAVSKPNTLAMLKSVSFPLLSLLCSIQAAVPGKVLIL